MKRLLALVLLGLVVLPTAFAAKPKKPPKKPPPPKIPACPHDRTLGRVAYVRDGALHVVELGTCADRTLVASGAAGPVAFSPDGKYIGFTGGVVRATGGRVAKGGAAWAPGGHANAWITKSGGVYINQHRILGDGWGAASVLWTPQGNLLISRSRYPRKPYHSEIWIWFQDTGNLRRVGGPFKGAQTPDLAGVSQDGSWAFFWQRPSGDVANPDGVPLVAKRLAGTSVGPVIAASMLGVRDYVTWCGTRLVAVVGSSTVATSQNSIVIAAPQKYHSRTLVSDAGRAWASVTCANGGDILAMAQPANSTGQPHWAIWTVTLKGQRKGLFSPPKGQSYESPRYTSGEGAVLFVRRLADGRGQLMVWKGGQLYGPISDFGTLTGAAGHRDWWSAADAHQ